jgi:hypothetical protein
MYSNITCFFFITISVKKMAESGKRGDINLSPVQTLVAGKTIE